MDTGWALAGAGLAVVAIVLAWPVPLLLARVGWPSRRPASALLLWQAIAAAGAVSMLGALAAFGLALLPVDLLAAGVAFGAGVGFVAHLAGHLAATAVSVGTQRRRHRALVELLGDPHPTRARTRIVDDGAPVAYCMPDGVRSITVLSTGLLERLDEAELQAVIAHEAAHAEQRHDLLLVAFRAWRSALPWFPIAAVAELEVAVLVELLADDTARRTSDADALARAIVAVAHPTRAPGPLRGVEPRRPQTRRLADRIERLAA